jgi:hypothetical protein
MKFLGLTWIITCLVFVLVLVNIVDANASRRPFKTQLNALTIVMAPLNVMTHLGTPQWLTASLATSGILRHPSPLLFPNVETLRAAYPIIRQEALAAVEASKSIQRDMFFTTIADDGWKRFYIKLVRTSRSTCRKNVSAHCRVVANHARGAPGHVFNITAWVTNTPSFWARSHVLALPHGHLCARARQGLLHCGAWRSVSLARRRRCHV